MPTVVELNTSSNPAFATIPDGAGLPDQTGHSGEYLTTDGVTASWGVVDLSSYLPLAGGTLTGNLSFSTGFKLIRHLAAAANVAGSVLSVLGSFGGDTATGDAAGNGGTVVLTAGYGVALQAWVRVRPGSAERCSLLVVMEAPGPIQARPGSAARSTCSVAQVEPEPPLLLLEQVAICSSAAVLAVQITAVASGLAAISILTQVLTPWERQAVQSISVSTPRLRRLPLAVA
jgi:hypothetical protein